MPRMIHLLKQAALALSFLLSLSIAVNLCALTVNAAACGKPNFKAAFSFNGGRSPQALVSADFNHDGKLDLAVVNNYEPFQGGLPTTIYIFLGSGDGTFSFANVITLGTLFARGIAIGDFNNDTNVDLAVANYSFATSNQRASILYGNGMGGFSAPVHFTVGIEPISITVADFNHDGKDDFATANYNENMQGSVSVGLNNGAGGFTVSSINVGLGTDYIVAGNFTNDSNIDLVAANGGSNNLTLLAGSGTGTFTPTTFTAGLLPTSIAVGDFNGDTRSDIAVTNYSSSDVSVLLQQAGGGFGSPTNIPVGAQPYTVAAGDVNGDGKVDLAVGHLTSNNAIILTGNGSGSFTITGNYFAGLPIRFAALKDFNFDGRADLALVVSSD
ncbi:MAG: VCBS repeat-containing protein, partial [Acidobacteria bacterium]|nr:VCBS repeat-containing protein [Acidobacteriota bacterium]